MVVYHNSIKACKSVDQSRFMANSADCSDICTKSKQNHHGNRNRKTPSSPNSLKVPICDQSRTAAVDVFIFIAVVASCGVLFFPYFKFVAVQLARVSGVVFFVMMEEFVREPLIYGSIGLGAFAAAISFWLVLLCMSRKCGNPNCKGLKNAREFDIQLETEESVKNSKSDSNNKTLLRDGVKKGLYQLPRDYYQELEVELKKMAPPNGRAVIVFRARCGCPIGRLEVPGPRKQRKIKK